MCSASPRMGATETNRRFGVFWERGKFPLLLSTPTAKAVMVQVGGVLGGVAVT